MSNFAVNKILQFKPAASALLNFQVIHANKSSFNFRHVKTNPYFVSNTTIFF